MANAKQSFSDSHSEPNCVDTHEVIRGSGNVFKDLGFAPEVAASFLIRSALMIQIEIIMAERELPQAELTQLLGVEQPVMLALLNGKIEDFSVDNLIRWLTRLGKEIVLKVRDSA